MGAVIAWRSLLTRMQTITVFHLSAPGLVGNDTIGEKILVTHFRVPQYSYKSDSPTLWKNASVNTWFGDSTFIIKQNKQYTLPNGMKCRDLQLTDTNSSRLIIAKLFYRNGHFFSISTLTDTLTKQSALLTSFFSSFKPVDTLKGESLFARKSELFYKRPVQQGLGHC